MTRYLLATASVHTTAAAADYLAPRLSADDEVVVVSVDESDRLDRDIDDAANVARSRLVPASIEVRRRAGDPAAEIRAAIADVDADVAVVGPRRGDPDSGAALGSTTRTLLETVEIPAVVVPLSDL